MIKVQVLASRTRVGVKGEIRELPVAIAQKWLDAGIVKVSAGKASKGKQSDTEVIKKK